MKLYYSPLACSMASRIALYEARIEAEFVFVDIHSDPVRRTLSDGSDFRAINPMGQVPALETDQRDLITENPVVLQYIADHAGGELGEAAGLGRYRMQEWLNFLGTELHKATYIPLLYKDSPEGARSFARQRLALRFGHLSERLKGHEFLMSRFGVADAYLFTILNWSPYAGINLENWPVLKDYYQRLTSRPSAAKALRDELKLYSEKSNRASATIEAATA